MNIVAALVLLAHGIAHLVGFVVPWRLAAPQGVAYKTTILAGHFEVGEAGIRVVGVLWLLVALAFAVAAAGALLRASWWPSYTLAVAVVSLAMCAVGWPDAKLGAPVNIGIIVVLVVAMRAGWSLVRA